MLVGGSLGWIYGPNINDNFGASLIARCPKARSMVAFQGPEVSSSADLYRWECCV